MDDPTPVPSDSGAEHTAARTTEVMAAAAKAAAAMTTVGAMPTLLFHRYRVLRELGRGGMGVVYLAHDTSLGIDVAVKIFPDLVARDEEALDALRKEVLRGMALQHPGIVRTHNFECDESAAGIVMEYIDGPTLAEVKRTQPGGCCDPEQILPWLAQLCPVIDYAHREARIVHRDLKPRNLMLTGAGRVKVADFGIAATLLDTQARHSKEGASTGTPSYMSPQQARGERPSPLDDIHALGATIYELLTSTPPFFRGSTTAIFGQVLQVVPPPMAERRTELEITGLAAIPDEWEAVVADCLAKDAAQRPQSAGEVLERLPGGPGARVAVPAREPAHEPAKTGPAITAGVSFSAGDLGPEKKGRGCSINLTIAVCATLLLALIPALYLSLTPSSRLAGTKSDPEPQSSAPPIPVMVPAPAATPRPLAVARPPAPRQDVEIAPPRLATTEVSAAVRRSLLAHVDRIATLSPQSRARLSQVLLRARRVEKLVEIHYAPGQTALWASSKPQLKDLLATGDMLSYRGDLTAQFVVLAFPDAAGASEGNLPLTQARAGDLVRFMDKECGIKNVVHAIPMGETTQLDPNAPARVRSAEIWGILP